MKKHFLFAVLLLTSLYSCQDNSNNLPDGLYAKIETNKGIILLQLDYEKAPITVANFVTLAEGTNTFITNDNIKNRPFYDGLKFHRVIPQFMIQGGDPLGTGSGDTGYKFKDEFSDLKFDKGGVLAMANNGPTTNSSQFFITHLETPWLDGKHTIFGHVVEKGMEVVNKIQQDDFMSKVTIIRNGEAAKKFNAEKVFSDYFAVEAEAQKAEMLKSQGAIQEKAAYLISVQPKLTKTTTGLKYFISQKSTGKKPANGTTVYIEYSAFFEDGKMFDSSSLKQAQAFGKVDPNKAAQNGYLPMPFVIGSKDGMIPGFIEGLEKLSIGDKAILFIPGNLGWGAQGVPGVIPPNATTIFEVELLEKMPQN